MDDPEIFYHSEDLGMAAMSFVLEELGEF